MAITRLTAPSITGLTIPNTSINNASLDSVTALPSGIATGKVLQVVQSTDSTATSTSSTSLTKITSLNVSITPSATSSKILLTWTGQAYPSIYTRHIFLNAIRTVGGVDTNLTNETNMFGWHYDTGTSVAESMKVFTYLDSPSTTSTITYYPAIKFGGGSGSITFGNASSLSTIRAIEIGA